jgi:hypothetical protein
MPRDLGIYQPYQVGAPPGAHYQALGGILAHAVRSGAINELGGQVVQYGRDAINNAGEAIQGYYNRLGVQDRMRQARRGDQTVPKRQRGNDPEDDYDYNNENQMDTAGDSAGQSTAAVGLSTGPSGVGSNAGFRGSLTGRGQTNDGYERYYREGDLFHSKETKTFLAGFGFSCFLRNRKDFNNEANPLEIKPFPGTINYGMVYMQRDEGAQNISDDISCFTPWTYDSPGRNFKEFNIGEHIYTNAINLYSNMLIDNKLAGLSGVTGLIRHYDKFRLHSFTIELQFDTQHATLDETYPGWWEACFRNAGWKTDNELTFDQRDTIDRTRKIGRIWSRPIKYLVYRDCDYLYTDSGGFINTIPSDCKNPLPANQHIPSRVVYAVSEIDKNISIVSDGEKYSYTRKINPQGNYFLERSTLASWITSPKPLDEIVAAIEGANSTNTVIKPLIEGFNLLYAPINAPVKWYGPFSFDQSAAGAPKKFIYVPMVQACPKLTLKIKAEWEAWNFDYVGTGAQPSLLTSEYNEPLEQLETDFRFSQAVNAMKKKD